MPERKAKLKLLILTSTYPRWKGDPEPGFVHELARRLTGDFDITVLCPSAPKAARTEVLDGVRVVRYRYAPSALEVLVNDGGIVTNLKRKPWKWLLVPPFILSMIFGLWREVARSRPDMVHAHWLLPQGFVMACLGILIGRVPPFLVTSHGADLYALRSKPFLSAKRFVAGRASRLTVVSEPMRTELIRIGVEPGKVSVQSMGVDFERRFTPGDAEARSRDEILFVGRLVEKKGLRHLIDALPAILVGHPAAVLTIVGFGPEEAERKAQVHRLGLEERVRFLGALPQEELPALYQRAAVFVAPFVEARSGDQEGLGLVALEAAGCGCPIVASDLPAVREVFGQSPVQLVPSGNVDALGAAISNALKQDASERVSMEVRDELKARFDWSVVTSNYAHILRKLQREGSSFD